MVVPGLAFDGRGGRLGAGNGHCDRTLGAVSRALEADDGFALQLVEIVPIEASDTATDCVITEAGAIVCTRE